MGRGKGGRLRSVLLYHQVIDREPNRSTPIRISSEHVRTRLRWLVPEGITKKTRRRKRKRDSYLTVVSMFESSSLK